MRSAWLCTRNDVLGNVAVLLAALGVFGTGAGWPDVFVAGIMAALALQASVAVVRNYPGIIAGIKDSAGNPDHTLALIDAFPKFAISQCASFIAATASGLRASAVATP